MPLTLGQFNINFRFILSFRCLCPPNKYCVLTSFLTDRNYSRFTCENQTDAKNLFPTNVYVEILAKP